MILSTKRGFTIIEVVIVLAIAGLIFSIVLWALPNLQKNQRDNSRQQIANNLEANLTQHATNLNGSYPATAPEFATFLNTFYECTVTPVSGSALDTSCNLTDPKGAFTWTWTDQTASGEAAIMTSATAVGSLRTLRNAKCSDTTIGSVAGAQGTRTYALMVKLENGLAYCVDNG